MTDRPQSRIAAGAAEATGVGSGTLRRLWAPHGFWQIRVRWAVAPLMIAAVVAGRLLGFEFPAPAILLIAVATLFYNALFALLLRGYRDRLEAGSRLDRVFTTTQVLADYVAMFLLIHFTGGATSPLVVFLIFHVLIAATQFSSGAAYVLAGVVGGGLWLLLAGQVFGWLSSHHIVFRGTTLGYLDQPAHAAVALSAFTATLLVAVGLVGLIMDRLRDRVGDLAEASSELAWANDRLQSLYRMLSEIGAQRKMQPVLDAVTAELSEVSEVQAVAVKLLSDDGLTLRFVAAHGFPPGPVNEEVIYLDRSPVNRRVIEDGVLVESLLDGSEQFQLQSTLSELGIRSVVLAPLRVGSRAIGTLGFYDKRRLSARDLDFLQLAAELVAIAIDHARAYEAIQALMRERTEFMLEVAHNLRSPLGASLGIVDLLTEGYLGEIGQAQKEHLDRLEDRLRALDRTIGELLAIARTRDRSREIEDCLVDLEALARETGQVFRIEAAAKGVALTVSADDDLPRLPSGVGLLEQLMENLVSNAIKYTPEGGSVAVRVDQPDGAHLRIAVEDTGIGIPAAEQGKLFREFFRASNARRMTPIGTGLGLVLVRQTVDRHGGTLDLTTEEGRGTKVTITLPVEREEPIAGGLS